MFPPTFQHTNSWYLKFFLIHNIPPFSTSSNKSNAIVSKLFELIYMFILSQEKKKKEKLATFLFLILNLVEYTYQTRRHAYAILFTRTVKPWKLLKTDTIIIYYYDSISF